MIKGEVNNQYMKIYENIERKKKESNNPEGKKLRIIL